MTILQKIEALQEKYLRMNEDQRKLGIFHASDFIQIDTLSLLALLEKAIEENKRFELVEGSGEDDERIEFDGRSIL